jgi:hypothetical protein
MADTAHVRGLRAVLRMLAPPCMAAARRFLLRRDAALDLAIIADAEAMRHASLISGDSKLAGGVGAGFALDTILVPFLNLEGVFNVGFVVVGTAAFNCPVGAEFSTPDATAVCVAELRDADAVRSVRSVKIDFGDEDVAAGNHGGRAAAASAVATAAATKRVMFDSENGYGAGGGVAGADDEYVTAGAAEVAGDVVVPQPMPVPSQAASSREVLPDSASASTAAVVSARKFSQGRYIRDERTGEILYMVCDVRAAEVETISLIWVGPPQGSGGKVRETVSVTCDARLFAAGALVESVMRCEHTVRVSAVPYVPMRLPASPTDLSNNASNMESYAGPTDGYIVPRSSPLARRRIDLAAGRHIFSSNVLALGHTTPRGVMLRNALLKIAVQGRMAAPTPMRWAMAPVVEIYLQALERAGDAVAARRLGLPSDDTIFDASEDAVVALLAAPSPLSSWAGTGSDSSGPEIGSESRCLAACVTSGLPMVMSCAAPISAACFGSANGSELRQLLTSTLSDVPMAMSHAAPASPHGLRTGSANESPLLSTRMSSDVAMVTSYPAQAGTNSVADLRGVEGGGNMSPFQEQFAPGLMTFAPAPPSSHFALPLFESRAPAAAMSSSPGCSGAERFEQELAAKVARRRASNIAAAKRSNAKRKQAVNELYTTLELAKQLRSTLTLRVTELREENAALKVALLGTHWD